MMEKLKAFADSRVKNKNQTQGFFYIIIGGYLCYIAYSLVKSYFDEQPSMPLWVAILCAVFFCLFGLAVMALGGYAVWYNYKQMDKQTDQSNGKDDENALIAPDDPNAEDHSDDSEGSDMDA